MRASTRMIQPVRPIRKGKGHRQLHKGGATFGRPPLWNPLWMGLSGFSKRVETRKFQHVQARWFQRVGRCGLLVVGCHLRGMGVWDGPFSKRCTPL